MIAAPRSGSGKTTVTLGLLRALARRGMKVSSFKCGPDYIDPAFHTLATGRISLNLDSWTMSESLLDSNFNAACDGTDIIIGEGSMGLFDGVATRGASGDGASADIAARYGLPVILVIDCSGQSQSAGAIALGFSQFDKNVKIAGVILGNIASERHRMLATRGVERVGISVLGSLPRGAVPGIPERHLGLVQAGEIPRALEMIDALADAMEKHLDINAIMNHASSTTIHAAAMPQHHNGKTIALAQDIAFSFVYPHMRMGWNIIPFSPLANEAPSPEADFCFLPGGYPELHAEQLSKNQNFMEGLRSFAKTKPVHGECGGYMVLGDTMVDADSKEWNMAGLLPLTTSFAKRKLHLGYRALTLACNTVFASKGNTVRGHEFHYATITRQGNCETLGSATDANGADLGHVGQRSGNVSGTFFHMVAAHG